MKPHAVLVPFRAQGHVNPMMSLAKLLHARGFHVTFVNTEFNHRRLIRSKGPEAVSGLPDFRFETIPDGMPPSDDHDVTQDIPLLCHYTRKTCLEPFIKLLGRLNTTPDIPKVSCVVADGTTSFAMKAAQQMGIPDLRLWTASVCSMIGYLHYRELIRRGITPFKNEDFLTDGTLNTRCDWVSGLGPDVRLKDLPSFIRTTDPDDIMFDFLGEEAQSCLNASSIIFNTFQEFEKEAIDTLISKFNYSNIYTIGPLPLLAKNMPKSEANSFNSSLWKPDSKVFEWLDEMAPGSVVYVNYGSITTMTPEHLQEFAWGLAKTNRPFLWIVRPDMVKAGGKLGPLNEEFFEEVKDRGLLVSWCAQDRVLAHESVGAFLMHCGWNSLIESVLCGLPVICWPFFADQQTNCYYSCGKWDIGMEINSDVKRDEVAELVKEMMGGGRGKKMRMKVKEWQRIAKEATDVGGGSYLDFNKLIKEGLHFDG